MSAQRETRTCRCGVVFRVLTYPRPGHYERSIWHCECLSCEKVSRHVTAVVAYVLKETPLAPLLTRIASTRLSAELAA